jgi:hypothetical protein
VQQDLLCVDILGSYLHDINIRTVVVVEQEHVALVVGILYTRNIVDVQRQPLSRWYPQLFLDDTQGFTLYRGDDCCWQVTVIGNQEGGGAVLAYFALP